MTSDPVPASGRSTESGLAPIPEGALGRAHQHIVVTFARWLNPRRLRVYPAAVLVAGILAWSFSQLLGNGLLDASGTVIAPDFLVFYTGGRFLLDGRLSDLYDFAAQAEMQRQLLAPQSSPGFSAYVYPPFVAIFLTPFSWGSYRLGLALWWSIGLLALAAALMLVRHELWSGARPSLPRLLFAALTFFPTLLWLFNGQASSFTLLLFAAFFVLLRRRRDGAAGFVLGLVAYKPQLMLGPILMLAVKRRWQALLGAVLTGALQLALCLALSPDALLAFLRLVPALPQLERTGLIYRWGLSSFFGFTVLLLDGISRPAADWLAGWLTALGLLTIGLWWRGVDWLPGTRRWDLTVAASIALGLMASPHLIHYDLMLLLLPFFIVWNRHPAGSADRPLDGGPLLAWTALLYCATFVGPYLAALQIELCRLLRLPETALQVSSLIVAGWAWQVHCAAQAEAGPPSAAPVPV